MDKLDIDILHSLLDNCRESDRQIGSKIGISGSAVKSRIAKMIKNKVIEDHTIKIEPSVFGYNLVYIVVTGQNTNEILKEIKLVGEPFVVVPVIGGITVCGIVVKENVEQKIEIAKKLMKGSRLLSIFEAGNPEIRSELTKTDVDIIAELAKNPLAKVDELAKKTNLSTKTVARCMQKLQNDEAVQFTIIFDPKKFGQYIPFVVMTQIDGKFDETVKLLRKEFGSSFLMKPFVSKNQLVLFLFSNDIFELDSVTQKIRTSKGVGSADLFIPKKILFQHQWMSSAIREAKSSDKLHLAYH
ncbi:MAG: Lrp/AsnC family transcriptional regulator [Candidatus Nitrosotenuis sp.]